MFDRILKRMREKIRQRQYVMTLHAEEEMNDGDLTIYDIERGILTGMIMERQRDRVTSEWKYCIRGETLVGESIEVVAKLSPTGKLVILTVYIPCG
jgi:hypothetical protein